MIDYGWQREDENKEKRKTKLKIKKSECVEERGRD
jgi:hypothetical protein